MATPKTPTRHRAYKDALGRVIDLPLADQLELFEHLHRHLSGEVGEELETDRQTRLRREALEEMRRAADHLGLPGDQAPTVHELDQALADLGSSWRSRHVIAAFGRYRTAKAAFERERIPLTPAQRSLLRAATGWAQRSQNRFEDHLVGLRRWLASKPASECQRDYDEFRCKRNDALEEGQRPLVRAATILSETTLTWADLLAVSKDEISLEAAERRSARAVRKSDAAEWSELVGGREAAQILGLTRPRFQFEARGRQFPLPAAHLDSKRLWRRADIRAYGAGRRSGFRTQHEDELQSDIMGTAAVAKALNMPYKLLRSRIKRKQWHLVPRPAGRVGSWFWFWRQSEIENWKPVREPARKGSRMKIAARWDRSSC